RRSHGPGIAATEPARRPQRAGACQPRWVGPGFSPLNRARPRIAERRLAGRRRLRHLECLPHESWRAATAVRDPARPWRYAPSGDASALARSRLLRRDRRRARPGAGPGDLGAAARDHGTAPWRDAAAAPPDADPLLPGRAPRPGHGPGGDLLPGAAGRAARAARRPAAKGSG